jgi:hypothetical protein
MAKKETKADREFRTRQAKQAKAHARLTAAQKMDLAFLERAKRFIERKGLRSNPRVMAAFNVLHDETESLVRQQQVG